jgi:hypothetical protein
MEIKFSVQSSAFDNDLYAEAARVLYTIGHAVADAQNDNGIVRDGNGNTIGTWQMTCE